MRFWRWVMGVFLSVRTCSAQIWSMACFPGLGPIVRHAPHFYHVDQKLAFRWTDTSRKKVRHNVTFSTICRRNWRSKLWKVWCFLGFLGIKVEALWWKSSIPLILLDLWPYLGNKGHHFTAKRAQYWKVLVLVCVKVCHPSGVPQ